MGWFGGVEDPVGGVVVDGQILVNDAGEGQTQIEQTVGKQKCRTATAFVVGGPTGQAVPPRLVFFKVRFASVALAIPSEQKQ
jgi:hypothetical protein